MPGPKLCDRCFFLPTRVAIIILAAIQGGVLNYYLVHYKNHNWYAWIAGDVAVVFSFLVAFFISYRELMIVLQANMTYDPQKEHSRVEPGQFPLMYFAWIVYAVILAARVAVIYKHFAFEIEPDVFLGTNCLRFTVAMAGIVFILLVAAHHCHLPGTPYRNKINLLTATVPFDVIDAVDILDVFFHKANKEELGTIFEWAVVVIACINLVLPFVPLMMLSGTHFGMKPMSRGMSTMHKMMHVFIINGPLLSVRFLLWYKQKQEVSPMIVKNIVVVLMIAMDLYEGEVEEKPIYVDDDEERTDMRADAVATVRYNA